MRSFGLAVLTFECLLLSATAHAAAPRHYDCTKAGNANKAACKSPGGPGVAAPAAAAPAPTVSVATPPKAARTYDCSKAGNKNKAACKAAAPSVAAAPSPSVTHSAPASAPSPVVPRNAAAATAPQGAGSPRIVAWTEKNGKVVHYDCSKAGNFNKKACKA